MIMTLRSVSLSMAGGFTLSLGESEEDTSGRCQIETPSQNSFYNGGYETF